MPKNAPLALTFVAVVRVGSFSLSRVPIRSARLLSHSPPVTLRSRGTKLRKQNSEWREVDDRQYVRRVGALTGMRLAGAAATCELIAWANGDVLHRSVMMVGFNFCSICLSTC